IGGREVFENEFPWMAGIISVNRSETICGASIINDRYVVTAAHCIVYGYNKIIYIIFSYSFNKDDLKVSVGSHNSCKWDTKSTIFSVDSIFPHPNYDNQTNFADIMLVKLIMSITFNEFVRPICLPNIECGLTGGISNRIVGGFVAIPHIFPWVVPIFQNGKLYCGGTLINDQYVLTAGHCVRWADHANLTVGIGIHDLENQDEGYIVPISKVILHEKFASDYLHDINDITLLRLQHPVKFNDNVRPACLPHKDSDYTGLEVKITGWGRVSDRTYETSRYLRQAALRVMPWQECKNTSFGDHISRSMMCAYKDDTDACQGDSGGPLMYERGDGKHEVIGIVSWGIGCAIRGSPGVYVKNTDYLRWIKFHSRQGVFCLDR
ncbi:Serine protease, partial [Ooceraea biroi]